MYLKIQTNKELLFFIEELEKELPRWIAVDTEFYRETTYFPVLSLIQIATESQVWVIDALSCTNLSPLKNIFENREIKKIFHAGDQDWSILQKYTGASIWPFSDTQLMAVFAKFGQSVSLESLVSQLLEIPIDKSQQKTDWLQRPLMQEQLTYAAQDAVYVAKIYLILEQKLIELGRDSWVEEEIGILFERYQNSPFSKDWLKLCLTKNNKWPGPFYAFELARWREEWAKKLDVPRRHIITDSLLERVIQEKCADWLTKNDCKGEVYEDLLSFLQRLDPEHDGGSVQKHVLEKMVKDYHQDFTFTQRKLLKKWQAKAKIIANKLEIPTHFVLNKQQLQRLVSDDKYLISGWRREFLGDFEKI